MNRRLLRFACAAGALLLVSAAALAQRGFRGPPQFTADIEFPEAGEFHFLRMEYNDAPGYSRGFGFVSRRGRANGWWAQDYPDAENHFTVGVSRLTSINIAEPKHTSLLDPELFEYPWAYSTQNNFMDLSREEIANLREYLNRGGFLMTDDMYDREGDVFYSIVKEVYPDQEIEDMTEADPMMNVHYTIQDKDRTFIPGARHLTGGGGVRPDGTPQWYKVSDAKGHVVMAINANTDLGDAWEYADDPNYPAEMTTLAYHYGINYIIYAMTH